MCVNQPPANQCSAYVFGPWVKPTDGDHFAYRSAPRDEDRAEVWLHVPDDGGTPYWSGCYGSRDCFDLREAQDLEDAQRLLDQRLTGEGHLLAGTQGLDLDRLADLVRQRDQLQAALDRLQAVMDAELGRKGLEGWKWDSEADRWELRPSRRVVARVYTHRAGGGWHCRTPGDDVSVESSSDALDGMEQAQAWLQARGFSPVPEPAPTAPPVQPSQPW
jgi:hypothetical protein